MRIPLIAPTILEALGVYAPGVLNSVLRKPIEGVNQVHGPQGPLSPHSHPSRQRFERG